MTVGGGGAGEGGGGAVNKAVAAGLLGLQFLSLPLAVVSSSSRNPRGAGLPGVELVSVAALAKAPRTLTVEEEMIREFVPIVVHGCGCVCTSGVSETAGVLV